VANLTGVPGDRSSSLGWKLADNPGGAVPLLTNEQAQRTMGRGKKLPNASECLVQLVRRQRFSRLCVLMNPYPAGRAILPDLAGEKT
jgi:hypothetical protein